MSLSIESLVKGLYNKTRFSKEVGVTKRTIERSLGSLQKKGKIERIGSKRTGKWSVIQ